MARTKQERELEQKRRAAALYTNGPERIRGDWTAVCRLLGVELDSNDEDVRRLIEEEGGAPPAVLPSPASSSGKTSGFDPLNAGSIPEAGILKQAKSDDEWCKLAKSLESTVLGIASGTVKASAAQAGTVRHILERCYGKVQERQSDMKPAAGVVLLPMMGENATAQNCFTTCPQCGFTTDREKK